MLKLYRVPGCPYCGIVKKKLAELRLPYEAIEVPAEHYRREEVFKVSGQRLVPVLVDGDRVFDDENEIIEYLEIHYRQLKEKPA